MAGCQTLHLRGGRFAAALAISFLLRSRVRPGAKPVTAVTAGRNAGREFRQDCRQRDGTGGDARADDRGPTYYPASGVAPTAPRVEMGIFDTVIESLFGEPDPNKWRPLPLGDFFSEGWNEAWAGGPAGQSGLTPRPRMAGVNSKACSTGSGW